MHAMHGNAIKLIMFSIAHCYVQVANPQVLTISGLAYGFIATGFVLCLIAFCFFTLLRMVLFYLTEKLPRRKTKSYVHELNKQIMHHTYGYINNNTSNLLVYICRACKSITYTENIYVFGYCCLLYFLCGKLRTTDYCGISTNKDL